MKACVLIPIYEQGETIRAVVESLEPFALDLLIVNDGSGARTRAVLDGIAQRYAWAAVHHFDTNRGKGAALKAGYRLASRAGFSHVLQLDADGQHDVRDVPAYLAAMQRDPGALVLGHPIFDASVPLLRWCARQLSRWIVWLCTLSFEIRDPLVGFRGVPLDPALRLLDSAALGDRMDFEPAFAVRMQWQGQPIVNLPTRIVYPRGGVSHFQLRRDYPLLARAYVRLLAELPARIGAARKAGPSCSRRAL